MEGGIYIINLIVAFDENRLIGSKNDLPWKISEDLKLFKRFTDGNIVIMGRKTYESIGKPLPNRMNVVITRNKDYRPKGVFVFHSVREALYKMKVFHREIFFIGGASIYGSILDSVDTMYISHVKGSYEGDTYFPEIDYTKWSVEEEESYTDFTFKKYVRKQEEIKA